jgi:methylenetetrahydrofolate dehydrogenase (NADP+)/methenyltetrahydrofolate cyclohydrolase
VAINFHDYLCNKPGSPNASETEILEMINFLNNDENIDAIIVQLPIPQQFNTQKIIDQISPAKDADGFHPKNHRKFLAGKSTITPPLILAVETALKATKENLANKKAVIVSKNPIFSDPLKISLENKGLKVVHTKPVKDLEKITKTADVLLVILGQPGIIKKEMIKEGAIVIDMGINLIKENKWVGDVDPQAAQVASWLTPVPGGIGPLTVACLLKNTYDLAKQNQTN